MLISGHDGGTGASPLTSLKHAGAPVGARPGRDPADAGAQRAARPDRRADRRPAEDRPRRGRRRAARRRGVRLRDRAAGRLRLRHDAGLPPRHLPGRRRHPEPRAARAVHRQARSSSSRSSSSSPRRCASTWPRSASAPSTRRSATPSCSTPRRRSTTGRRSGLDLSPDAARAGARRTARSAAAPPAQDHGLEKALDNELIALCDRCAGARRAGPGRRCRSATSTARSARCSGTRSPGATAAQGLPDGTIDITFTGSAGQSFGAFLPRGHHAAARRRRERLRRQGPVRRPDRRPPGPGRRPSPPSRTSSPATSSCYGATGGEVVPARPGRRAVLRAQLRRHRGRRGRRRPRLRVHDRRPRRRARPHRAQLRRRHVRRRRRTCSTCDAGAGERASWSTCEPLDAEDARAARVDLRRAPRATETGSPVAAAAAGGLAPRRRRRFTKVMPRDYTRVLGGRRPRPRADPGDDRASGRIMEASRG